MRELRHVTHGSKKGESRNSFSHKKPGSPHVRLFTNPRTCFEFSLAPSDSCVATQVHKGMSSTFLNKIVNAESVMPRMFGLLFVFFIFFCKTVLPDGKT